MGPDHPDPTGPMDPYVVDGTTDYYAVLGLPPWADEAAIARARARARRHRDDPCTREALAVLGTPSVRRVYDYARGPQDWVRPRRRRQRWARRAVAIPLVAFGLLAHPGTAGPVAPTGPAPMRPVSSLRAVAAPRYLFGVCVTARGGAMVRIEGPGQLAPP